MNNIWFIADTHFQHKNILEFEPIHRPFRSIEEHDETIIANWNRVVRPNDIIWHLGDFCFGGRGNVSIAGRLNGHRRLVMGNHDCYGVELYAQYFEKVYGAIHYKEFILTHIPIKKAYHPEIVNIHGHTHSKSINEAGYICVSVEQTNLTPIHIDEISAKIKANSE